MKKTMMTWAMLAILLPLTACGSNKNLTHETMGLKEANNMEYSKTASNIKRNLDVKDFHGISNSLGVEIYYTQGSRYQVTAETTAENWNKCDIQVENGILKVTRNKKYPRYQSMNINGNILLHITAPNLDLLSNNGAMKFHADHWKAGNIKFQNNGALTLSGSIDQAASIILTNNGAVNYQEGSIQGTNFSVSNNGASTLTIPIQLSGDLHISNNGSHKLISSIKAASYTETCNGASNDQVDIQADELKQSINGTGKLDIHFKGKNADIAGSGSVHIDMQLDCDKLTVRSSGSAKIKIAGTADDTTIKNDGIIKVDVSELNKF